MWSSLLAAALLFSCAPTARTAFATLVSSLSAGTSSNSATAYEEFRRKYGRASNNGVDAIEYVTRQDLFESRRKAVEVHNSARRFTWVATVNKFADYTQEELNSLWGYRRVGGRWHDGRDGSATASEGSKGASVSSFLEQRRQFNVDDLAEAVDWRSSATRSTDFLRDQGACGSCWAVAAVGAIEMHAELQGGHSVPLSYEQLVDCVPNPRNCGGTGGCKGATAELAFKYVSQHGIVAADRYAGGYQHGGDGTCQTSARTTATIADFETLEFNKLLPMLETIAVKGPAVASVDASGWASYSSGVFDSCEKNATVNHAILVVGYGVDRSSGKLYWLIRNSWGGEWGEAGYIRLERHSSDEGVAGHCGTDNDPKEGVGCDGGPASLPVCGMCGILSDTAYPKDVKVRHSRRKGPMASTYSNIAINEAGKMIAQ